MCIKGNKRRVLCCLCKYDYRRPYQIANELKISINTVSNVLGLLKKEGLVYCLNEDYYRPRLYRVTEKGKKRIEINLLLTL